MRGMEIFFFVTAGWIVSLCLHEFAHALVAHYGGDHTVKGKGYLTLNPLRYADPMYSFVMPMVFLLLGGIGLPGGAVQIRADLLRSKTWRTAMSLAGIAVNVVGIFVLCVPFWCGLTLMDHPRWLAPALAFLIQLEICAVIFNLLPIPPLDGFQALAAWLPRRITTPLYIYSQTILWIFFLLLCSVPVLNHALWDSIAAVSNALGVNPLLSRLGWSEFRFWKH